MRRPAVSKEIWGKQRRTSLKWLPSKGGVSEDRGSRALDGGMGDSEAEQEKVS